LTDFKAATRLPCQNLYNSPFPTWSVNILPCYGQHC